MSSRGFSGSSHFISSPQPAGWLTGCDGLPSRKLSATALTSPENLDPTWLPGTSAPAHPSADAAVWAAVTEVMRSLSAAITIRRSGSAYGSTLSGSITADTVRTGSLPQQVGHQLAADTAAGHVVVRVRCISSIGTVAITDDTRGSGEATSAAIGPPSEVPAMVMSIGSWVSIQPISERISATARIVISTLEDRVETRIRHARHAARPVGRKNQQHELEVQIVVQVRGPKVNRSSGLPWAAPCTQISQRRREPPWLSTRADASSSAAGSNPATDAGSGSLTRNVIWSYGVATNRRDCRDRISGGPGSGWPPDAEGGELVGDHRTPVHVRR